MEKFTQRHDRGQLPLQASRYRDLIPAGLPDVGQQYAFDVDLDACSGCKACVTACHNLNGLEPEETWRGVGLLTGGTAQLPVIQHVTTACHHCLQPACLEGCPVEAYEKDPVTGIVRHLDDQCIGCQYCIFKCPYDVPQYSRSKGIVRKCDMCQDRLAEGEAPACVQSCPNQAIRISVVNTQDVMEESEVNAFLPAAPEPGYTLPSTTYRSRQALPRNMLPADYYSARPQHGHLPLVFMLVLTQMSVGGFLIEQLLSAQLDWLEGDHAPRGRFVHLAAALLLGLLGMSASIFHLGRPQYAFRAWIGLRTSWLSREILAFGMFAMLASLYVAAAGVRAATATIPSVLENALGIAAAGAGIVGVACSIMIYVDTQREFWRAGFTVFKFFGTAAVLGLPTAALISLGATALAGEAAIAATMSRVVTPLCQALLVLSIGKLLFECLIFLQLQERRHTPLKRTALLMKDELGLTTIQRFFFGVVGGLLLPGLVVAYPPQATGAGFSAVFVALAMSFSLASLLLGELIERYLFFAAVVAPRMPGGPAS